MSERYISNLNPRDPGPGKAQKFASYADTRQIHYEVDPGLGVDEATLNRDIPRVEPDRDVAPNPVFAELTGKIRVPVMTIHETADFVCPFGSSKTTESAPTRPGHRISWFSAPCGRSDIADLAAPSASRRLPI